MFSEFEQYKLKPLDLTDKKLGQGSHATVVEANYMGLKCAGKVLHETLVSEGDASYTIRRFKEECRILSRIRHPNIVQFLGVYFQDNEKVPVLVMEYLPTNLTTCIDRHGILPAETSYSILQDVAMGLYYLHKHSPPIVHRDLTANNVLLTSNMEAKISDLGVARMLNLTPLQVSRMTQTPGTPAYMPPEVMVVNPIYNTSVDEFSFGVLMIHLFSGKWPQTECSQIRMEAGRMIPVSEAERRQNALQCIGADHPIMNLILKCINNDPKQRPHVAQITEKLTEMVAKYPTQQLCNQIERIGTVAGEEKTKDERRKISIEHHTTKHPGASGTHREIKSESKRPLPPLPPLPPKVRI